MSSTDNQPKILCLGLRFPREREVLKTMIPNDFLWGSPARRQVWTLVRSMGEKDSISTDLVRDYCERNDLNESTITATIREALEESISAPSFFLSVVEEEIEKQRVLSLLDQAVSLVKGNDISEASEILASFQKSQSLSARQVPVVDYWSDWDERTERRKKVKDEGGLRVGFGVEGIDECFKGGLKAGEVGIVVGHTGRGKSVMSQNLAVRSAQQGALTLYVPTEMSCESVADRLDSRILGVPLKELTEGTLSEEDLRLMRERRERLGKMYAQNLKVWAVPPLTVSPTDLERTIDRLEQDTERRVETLIVDSPDHLISASKHEYRLQMADIYWNMKRIAESRKVALWVTTQAPKEFKYKLLTAEAVADSYDKARIADVIVTLNQSVVEEGAEILRLHVAKNRNGQSGRIVPLKLDFGMMRYREAREDELV